MLGACMAFRNEADSFMFTDHITYVIEKITQTSKMFFKAEELTIF